MGKNEHIAFAKKVSDYYRAIVYVETKQTDPNNDATRCVVFSELVAKKDTLSDSDFNKELKAFTCAYGFWLEDFSYISDVYLEVLEEGIYIDSKADQIVRSWLPAQASSVECHKGQQPPIERDEDQVSRGEDEIHLEKREISKDEMALLYYYKDFFDDFLYEKEDGGFIIAGHSNRDADWFFYHIFNSFVEGRENVYKYLSVKNKELEYELKLLSCAYGFFISHTLRNIGRVGMSCECDFKSLDELKVHGFDELLSKRSSGEWSNEDLLSHMVAKAHIKSWKEQGFEKVKSENEARTKKEEEKYDEKSTAIGCLGTGIITTGVVMMFSIFGGDADMVIFMSGVLVGFLWLFLWLNKKDVF